MRQQSLTVAADAREHGPLPSDERAALPSSASAERSARSGATPLVRRDFAIALALFAVALAAYLALRQRWLLQDGPGLVLGLLFDEPRQWMHIAILPLARCLASLCPAGDPSLPLALLSAGGGALGLAALFLTARRLGAQRVSAGFAALLVGASPAVLFHATLIEVHALHFGTVALCALATACAPWRRPALAHALLAAITCALYWTHRSAPLLLPGWVFFAAACRAAALPSSAKAGASSAARRWWPSDSVSLRSVIGIGLAQAAGLAVAIGVAAAVRGEAPFVSLSSDASLVAGFGGGFSFAYASEEWLLPIGLLLPLAALAFASVERGGALGRPVLLALLLPSFVFFLWWGEHTQGGYTLGSLPFLGLLVARLRAPRRLGAGIGAVLLIAQCAWSRAELERFDARPAMVADARERAAAFARAVDGEGYVLALDPSLLPAHLFNAHVREENGAEELLLRAGRGLNARQIARQLSEPLLELVAAHPGHVAVHLGLPAGIDERLREYPNALRELCELMFAVEPLPDARYPLLRLRPRDA